MRTTVIRPLALVAALWGAGAGAEAPRPADMLGNTCAGCHGTFGASAGLAMPIIGGLNKRYLYKTMVDSRSGARPSTVMGRMMRGYSDLEIKAIAAYFSDQPWVPAEAHADPALVRAGERIHRAQCESCHGESGRTNRQEIPRLAGQWPGYLSDVLRDLRDVDYPGPQPLEMRERVQALSDEQIQALSHYYASRR